MTEDSTADSAEQKLAGIAGWLLVPFLGLLIGAFDHSNTLLDHELPRAVTEVFVGNLVLAVGSLVLFTLLCLKHPLVPMLMLVYAVTDIAFHTLEYVATSTDLLQVVPELAASEGPRVLENLRTTVGFWIIFVPYFLVSKRVKNTFVDEI